MAFAPKKGVVLYGVFVSGLYRNRTSMFLNMGKNVTKGGGIFLSGQALTILLAGIPRRKVRQTWMTGLFDYGESML
jgi:hypothetical protein